MREINFEHYKIFYYVAKFQNITMAANSVSRINSFQISTPHLTSGTRSTTAKEFSPLTGFQT